MKFKLRTANKPGLFVGIALVLAGALAAAYPQAMVVDHGSTRPGLFPGLKTVEFISQGRARFYGGCVTLAGLALGLFSLYDPKHRKPVAAGSTDDRQDALGDG